MQQFYGLLKIDLKRAWRSPAYAYLLAAFALFSGVIFATSALAGFSLLASEIQLMQGFSYLFIPLLCVRHFAADQQGGQAKLWRSMGISSWTLVLSKYLSLSIQFLGMAALFLPHFLLTAMLGGRVDAISFSSYFAYLLNGAFYVAIALYLSLFTQQVANTGFLTFFFLLLLQVLASLSEALSSFMVRALETLDVFKWGTAQAYAALRTQLDQVIHFLLPSSKLGQFERGLFSLTAVLYFLLGIVFVLFLAWRKLERSYEPKRKQALASESKRVYRRRRQVATAVFLLFALLYVTLFRVSTVLPLWDLSQSGLASLSSVSQQLLRQLKSPVRLNLIESPKLFQENYAFLPALLQAYEDNSNGKVDLVYLDPEADRAKVEQIAKAKGLRLSRGSLLVENVENGRSEHLSAQTLLQDYVDENTGLGKGNDAEGILSSTIHYLQEAESQKAYDLSLEGQEPLSRRYRLLTQMLKASAYDLDTLDLRTEEKDIEAGDLLLLVDPARDLSEVEALKLEHGLRSGAKLFLSLSGRRNFDFPRLNQVLASFGIGSEVARLRQENASFRYGGNPYALLATLPRSPLSETQVERAAVALDARLIQFLPQIAEGVERFVFLETPTSTKVEALTNEVVTESEKGLYPLLVGSLHKGFQTEGKMAKVLVFATDELFSDLSLQELGEQSYNGHLGQSALAWLGDQKLEHRLLIPRKLNPTYQFSLGLSLWFYLASGIALVGIPAFLFGLGLVKRRRYGH